MYPYVRQGQDWPWASVPVRQVFYEDAQIAKENPAPAGTHPVQVHGRRIVVEDMPPHFYAGVLIRPSDGVSAGGE